MLKVLKRIPARIAIALGQTALVSSVLLSAIAMNLIPSERGAIVQGRASLCEAIAVSSSISVTRRDPAGLRAMLEGIAKRNPDVMSVGVRTAKDDKLVVEIGEHRKLWSKPESGAAADSYVYVPIYSANQKWGTIEVRFRPLSGGGLVGFLTQPSVRLVLFVSSASAVLFFFYLRKMLKHLDPSKVVPKRVRSALDTLAEGLLVVDNDNRIVLANQSFAAAVGEPPEALLGREASAFAWVLPDGVADPKSFEFPWKLCAREQLPQMNQMLRLSDGLGVRRTFSVNCSPVLGQDGQYRGVLSSFDDVTRLEAQEAEVRKSRDAAESANRAKSEFLARMSHEIRTPMNAILGFADVLRRGFEQDEAERQDYLNTIHSSGQHLLALINDILDLSKIESGKMEVEHATCSPHDVIREVVNVLRVRANEKGIALDYAWDAGGLPATITTDPTRFRQALTNLVGNAIKFTERGSVRVVAGLRGGGGRGAAPRLFVDVIDTGIGIKPDAVERIFQPFAQADTSVTRRFGGTGLGLAISRQLAEALGGELTIESEFGKGSRFMLTIDPGPLADTRLLLEMPTAMGDAHAAVAGGVLAVGVRRLPRARVLLAEDGVTNQKLVTLVLERAGVEVDIAENGQIAIEKATAGGHDVVLMDMQMPLVDGYTATRTLRAQGFDKPIIALTAHAMTGEREKCLAAGCSDFLTKPIDMDLLISTLAGILSGEAGEQPASPTPMEATALVPDAPKPTRNDRGGPIESTLPTDDADFREIVNEFVDRLHTQIGEMQTAWEGRELGQIAMLAHRLKGSGGTAGFGDFTMPAARLEQVAKEARLEDVQAGIDELVALARRVVAPREPAEPVTKLPVS